MMSTDNNIKYPATIFSCPQQILGNNSTRCGTASKKAQIARRRATPIDNKYLDILSLLFINFSYVFLFKDIAFASLNPTKKHL